MKLAGLHWFRRRQRTLGRVALSLFCLTWLQLAMAPCLMALDQRAADARQSVQMQDCPGMAADEHCPYCPPATSGDHASCAFPHDPQVDSRVGFVAALLAPPTAFALLVPHVADTNGLVIAAAPPPLPQASITVSLCRYLR